MSTLDVCVAILVVAGAFALVSLGILLLKAAKTLQDVSIIAHNLDITVTKVNKTVDDINYKLDLLNAPVELVKRTFTKKRNFGSNLLGFVMNLFRKK